MRVLSALALCGLLAAPAHAHVTIDPASAPAGSYVRVALRVPHGCQGAATTRLTVEFPTGVYSAKPQPRPGWSLLIEFRTLPASQPMPHGRAVETEVARITWEGGRLDDAHYDEFLVMLQAPNEPGGTLVLPVTQGCEGGRTEAWVERAQAGQSVHDLARPAPVLRLTRP